MVNEGGAASEGGGPHASAPYEEHGSRLCTAPRPAEGGRPITPTCVSTDAAHESKQSDDVRWQIVQSREVRAPLYYRGGVQLDLMVAECLHLQLSLPSRPYRQVASRLLRSDQSILQTILCA